MSGQGTDYFSLIAGAINNTNTNIANLGSTLMTNLFNRRNVDANNSLQRLLANQANQWQIDQRNYENWYNSPVGLQSRGLNPALAMSAGGSSLAPSVSAGEAHMADTEAFRAIAPQFTSPSQDQLAMSQISLNEADAAKKRAEVPVLDAQRQHIMAQTAKAANEAELLGMDIQVASAGLQQKIDNLLLSLDNEHNRLNVDKTRIAFERETIIEQSYLLLDKLREERNIIVNKRIISDKQKEIVSKQAEIVETSLSQAKVALDIAEKNKDWYTADKIIGYVATIVGAISGAVAATAGLKRASAAGRAASAAASAAAQRSYDNVDLDDYNLSD